MRSNDKVSEGVKQFADFLVLKNNEARWAGYQFSLILLCVFGIIGLYGYENYLVEL